MRMSGMQMHHYWCMCAAQMLEWAYPWNP